MKDRIYLSNTCYWDSKNCKVYQDGKEIQLTESQVKIMQTLIEAAVQHPESWVTHRELYRAMKGKEPPLYSEDSNWKTKVNYQINLSRVDSRGLYQKITTLNDVNPYYGRRILDHSKANDEGYRILLPVQEDNTADETALAEYRGIWNSISFFENESRRAARYLEETLRFRFEDYLKGGPCNWSFFFSDQFCPVEREVITDLMSLVERGTSTIVLTGAGGEGKTTILHQLFVLLCQAGRPALYHVPTWDYSLPELRNRYTIIVDNPPLPQDSRNFEQFYGFLSSATNAGHSVVLAARSNEWGYLEESLPYDIRRGIKEVQINKLSQFEATSFAQCIKNAFPKVGRSTRDLETLFEKESEGFLYASMLLAVYDTESLEKTAENIVYNISCQINGLSLIKVLAAIVFSEHAGVQVTTNRFRMLCDVFDLDPRDVKKHLRKEVSQNGKYYQTRHETISNLFYKYLYSLDTYLNDPEDIAIKVVNVLLEECSGKEIRYGDPLADECTCIFCQSLSIVVENRDYIIQRIFETCQQYGRIIIDRVFMSVSDSSVKKLIAEKCYNSDLPMWNIYCVWSKDCINCGNLEMASSILKHLCINLRSPAEEIWVLWAAVEEQKNNNGNNLEFGTAAWIYQECLIKQRIVSCGHAWNMWAKFIDTHLNNPTLGNEPINSGIDILRLACLEYDADSNVWISWAKRAIDQGKIGDYETRYSAAWILKTCCLEYNPCGDPAPWEMWARFSEEYQADLTATDEKSVLYLPKDILKAACIDHNVQYSELWGKWALAEEKAGNVGSCSIEHSAAWVFYNGCLRGTGVNGEIWSKWVSFFHRNPDAYCLEERTALGSVLRGKCLSNKCDSVSWSAWARYEELIGCTGDYQTEYSAAWIHRERCHRFSKDAGALLDWAKFAFSHPIRDESGSIITATSLIKQGEESMTSFTQDNWIDLNNFKKKIGYGQA